MIGTNEIRNQIHAIWPDLEFIILTDPEWQGMTLSEFREWDLLIPRPDFVKNKFECEEFSGHFVFCQREMDSIINQDGLNIPIGFVWGRKFQIINRSHYCCIGFTSDAGPILLERQNGKMWIPDKDKDDVQFLFM